MDRVQRNRVAGGSLCGAVDGREYRRLTDDAARDRGPAWSPDGQTIYFYSDREGHYELWQIRPDRSRLQVMTKSANANFPTVSPDGRRIALAGVSAEGMSIRDVSSGPDVQDVFEPPPGPGEALWPFSWSRDNRLLGMVVSAVRGYMAGVSLSVSADNTWYTYTETGTEGDIWIARLRKD